MARRAESLDDRPEPGGRDAPVPLDHEGLDESDVVDAICSRLRDVGGNAFDRVLVRVENGGVVLDGEIPAEAQRSVAIQVVADIAALPLREDRMRVTIGWESRDDAITPGPPDTPELARAEGIEQLNEDPVKTGDEGAAYDPPVDPQPEEE
jgi:hypothetical protein